VPKSFDYIFGADVIAAATAFIPRAIWPEKPTSESIRVFDREILDSQIATSSPYPIAEGYLNGGLVGIVFVLLTMAFLQRLLYALFNASEKNHPLMIVSYLWFFYMVVNIDSWVLPAYGFLIQRALIFGLVYFIFTWKLPAFKQIA